MIKPEIAIKAKQLKERYAIATPKERINIPMDFAKTLGENGGGARFFSLCRNQFWTSLATEFPSFEMGATPDNHIISAAQFAEQYGDDEHEAYPVADWDLCSKHGHTDLEYWEWVREQVVDEAGEGMSINDEADRWSGADAHSGEARTSSPSPSP